MGKIFHKWFLMLIALLYCGNLMADVTSEMKPYNIGTPNMDFENGSLENWEQYIGGYYFDAEDNTYKYDAWEEVEKTDRISLITYPTIDPIISCWFDFTTSPSKRTTVRVGSYRISESYNTQTTKAAAERLVYRFKVTEEMGSLLYGYAPVLHLGNPDVGLSTSEHTDEQKPNITVSVSLYDTLTGVSTILPNSEFSAIKDKLQYPDAETPCQTSTEAKNLTDYAFHPWTNNEIDLSPYIGQVLKIEVINHDCLRTDNKGVVSPGGHRSYGYFSAEILQPKPEMSDKYLCFTAEETGSEIWVENKNTNMPDIEYTYAGNPWTPLYETELIVLGEGTKIYFRGNNPNGFSSEEGIVSFKMTGKFSASGNVMSLIDGTGESTTIPNDYCFAGLFKGCTSLTKAPELPSIQLTNHCYAEMFEGCTALQQAPELPATELVNGCYNSMFKGCSELNYIKVGVLSLDNDVDATKEWVDGVDSEGIFVFPCGSKYDKHGISEVPMNFEIKAFPIVVFQNPDGTELWRDTISCGETPTYKGEIPTYGEGYSFKSWNKGFTELTEPGTYYYTAKYEKEGQEENNYLHFFANVPNSVIWYSNKGENAPDMQYSLDKGATWQNWEKEEKITLENIGDKIYVRGNNPDGFSKDPKNYTYFVMTGFFDADGSVMSLIDGTGESKTIPNDYCFYALFQKCSSLTWGPELPATELKPYCYAYMFANCENFVYLQYEDEAKPLPATTLQDYCYQYMFLNCSTLTRTSYLPATELAKGCYKGMYSNCTSLTTVKELPATKLYDECYDDMFSRCTSLKATPNLPATTLANKCYNNMFAGCANLTQVSELPASKLANQCYASMFLNCTKLEESPQLPATEMTDSCYYKMFEGCTNLAQAPELPAKQLDGYCYQSMFAGCSNLAQAPELPATELADGCYQQMFANCTSLTKAPELPAEKTEKFSYYGMFMSCEKISFIKVGFNNWEGMNTNSWVVNVAPTGTFICPKGLPEEYGIDRIPEGWNMQYNEGTDMTDNTSDNCTVWTEGLSIIVRGAQGNIQIYNLNGQLIHSGESDADETVSFPMSAHGAYIVKTKTQNVKVEL